jgi:hypothetical protein
MRRSEPEVEGEVRRLAAKDTGCGEIGRMLGCSRHAVTNTLRREPRPLSSTAWNLSPARLSIEEPEEIRVGLERGDTFTAIAPRLRRAVSTVSRVPPARLEPSGTSGLHIHRGVVVEGVEGCLHIGAVGRVPARRAVAEAVCGGRGRGAGDRTTPCSGPRSSGRLWSRWARHEGVGRSDFAQ